MTVSERATLLREAREGSEEALNELFADVAPHLLALIRLRLGPTLRRKLDSQDLLQSTLLKAFVRLEQYDGAGSQSLIGWLAAIARNEVLDQAKYFQRAGRRVAAEVPIDEKVMALADEIRSEVSRLTLQRRESRLEEAIEELKPEHREVILLRRYEDLSFGEIGQRLERSPDACRMLFARAMTALTNLMPDDE